MADPRPRLEAALAGRYAIERQLGRGGMSRVYLARELMADRPVALKVLHPDLATGYSALAVALALPPDGRVTACDVSEEFTAVARRYWGEAGVNQKIDLRLAPAADTLAALLAEGRAGSYDFAFIDADKEGYDTYYERTLELLRPGGLVVIDNVLWSGDVADPDKSGPELDAIRQLNRKLHGDERVDLALLPVADGLTLARKR